MRVYLLCIYVCMHVCKLPILFQIWKHNLLNAYSYCQDLRSIPAHAVNQSLETKWNIYLFQGMDEVSWAQLKINLKPKYSKWCERSWLFNWILFQLFNFCEKYHYLTGSQAWHPGDSFASAHAFVAYLRLVSNYHSCSSLFSEPLPDRSSQ